MDNSSINSLIDLLAVSGYSRQQINRMLFQSGGHVVIPIEHCGFVGGNITQIQPDEHGRIIYKNIIVSPLLACGHITTTINDAGACYVCKRLICVNCLRTCDLTGRLVCRAHSIIKDGVVIGNHARKGLWRFKARKLANSKEYIPSERQISYK